MLPKVQMSDFILYLSLRNLRSCRIKVFTTAMMSNIGESLRYLDISNNEFSNRPHDFFTAIPNLVGSLWMNGNKLTSLPPGLFDPLTKIRHVTLAGNRISDFGPHPFRAFGNVGTL